MIKQTHKITTQKLDKILKLKEKGLTLREIGQLSGLTGEGVRYLINRFRKVGSGKTGKTKN